MNRLLAAFRRWLNRRFDTCDWGCTPSLAHPYCRVHGDPEQW